MLSKALSWNFQLLLHRAVFHHDWERGAPYQIGVKDRLCIYVQFSAHQFSISQEIFGQS